MKNKFKMAMYIDSNNFYKNVCELYPDDKISIKWESLILGIRDIIKSDYDCRFAKSYYSALSDRSDNPNKYDNHKRFLDKLGSCPYIDVIIGKLARVALSNNIPIDRDNPNTYKHIEKKTDINMNNGMLSSSADIIVILSDDSDFCPTVNLLKRRGKIVLLVAPVGSKGADMENTVGQENVYYIDQSILNRYVIIKPQKLAS